jgi:hypothetical protein
MAHQWYYEKNGKSHGPFSASQLQERAADGRIQRQDTVWKEGLDKRVPAIRVQHLFAVAPASPPPAATAQLIAAPDLSQPPTERPPPEPEAQTAATAPPAEAPATQPAPPSNLSTIPDDPDLMPLEDEEAPPETEAKAAETANPASKYAKEPDHRRKPEVRKRRVISIKGGMLMGQDGEKFKLRKKCERCAREDTSVVTMAIPMGSMRLSFFCPKCKKNSPVEIMGAS